MYPIGYNQFVIKILQTEEFDKWLHNLRDRKARMRVNVRIRRFSLGNPGDFRSVGADVHELRIYYGPGYRVYFVYKEPEVAVLLYGGNKKTQNRDIKKAKQLAQVMARGGY